MTKLSVNINKIATLRNARGGNVPDVVKVALDCESFGADGILKQFTEDYRLSVTPENAEIFTLLFIREYGLPADFNTNESYKEFTHKGNFKPLDQEMSELQSKKGYSEKAFYNIQNRQQQLADKILGLRYRLTCPPLQLTGPAASEKRKTASRQNKSHNPRI